MAFTSTANLKTYANNLEALSDKPGNLGALIDELQTGAATYEVITGTSQQAVAGVSYIPTNGSLTTITLPATAAVGQRVSVIGQGAGGWRVGQNSGQTINFNASATTTGTGGQLNSANRYNSVHLVCTVANTTWVVSSVSGAPTVV